MQIYIRCPDKSQRPALLLVYSLPQPGFLEHDQPVQTSVDQVLWVLEAIMPPRVLNIIQPNTREMEIVALLRHCERILHNSNHNDIEVTVKSLPFTLEGKR